MNDDAPTNESLSDDDAMLRQREANLRAYARLLDSAVRLPGGFRVGLDGLVGLVPVVGDLVGVGLSGYLVVAAARLGIPRSVVARMIANVALESTIGMIPIVGDAFDFVFKANERNVRLLERELDRRIGTGTGNGAGNRTGNRTGSDNDTGRRTGSGTDVGSRPPD